MEWRPAADGQVEVEGHAVTLVSFPVLLPYQQALAARLTAGFQAKAKPDGTVDLTDAEEADTDRAAALKEELERRIQTINQTGYDYLYEAACIKKAGLIPVPVPLMLKSGESGYMSVTASLARYVSSTRYVGGSHGVSIPLGHGFRYRVGAFAGQPVKSTELSEVDTGTVVLTNQRLVFVGAQKSVAVPIEKILSLEVFPDGLSVHREGKEAPDIFVFDRAARLAAMLNLLHQGASSP